VKGFWFTVESIIACSIIVSFLLVAAKFYVIPAESADLSEKAYEILEGLDKQDILRNYTVSHDYSGLNSEVRLFIYNHSVQICDQAGTCYGPEPAGRNIWAATYIISGYQNYSPHEIKLYVW